MVASNAQPVGSIRRTGDDDFRVRTPDCVGQRGSHQRRCIVLRAQVRCHQMFELGMHQFSCNIASGRIRQMAIQATDASLEELGIRRHGQHARVMIAFEQQGIAGLQTVQHIGRRMTEVGEDAELGRAVRAGQLKRFAGIVRHRERGDLQTTQGDVDAVPRHMEPAFEVGLADCLVRAAAHPDRNLVAARQRLRAADVVAVLVRDEDRVDVRQRKAAAGQSVGELTNAKPAIHEQAGGYQAACLDQRGIAAAATAQTFKAQHDDVFSTAPAQQRTPNRRAKESVLWLCALETPAAYRRSSAMI